MHHNAAASKTGFKLWYVPALLAALAVFALAVFPGYALGDGNRGRVKDNISVGGISLAGLNRQEALSKLTAAVDAEIKSHRLLFRRGDRKWIYSYEKLGLKPDIEGAVERALNAGNGWNPIARYRTLQKLRQQGLNITLEYTMDNAKTEAVLTAVKSAAGEKPQNARLVFDNNGELAVRTHVNGFELNMEKLREQVQVINLFEDTEIEVAGSETVPGVTTAGVEGLKPTGLLAGTTSKFNPGVPNRVNNIAVAAKALNNTLLAPGEEFSFNRVVGPRTADRGFQAANVIVGGKFVLDLGGGICQVSSTLYNSVVKSGLAVTERSPHSLPVAYLPMGADATVSFGAIDFKFRNTTGKYVLIKSYMGRDTLTVQVVGDARPAGGKSVKIISEKINETPYNTVWRNDPTLPKGQQKIDNPGSKGYLVKVYKITTFNDGTVKRELVNKSRYRPYDRVILVGTKG